MAETAVHSGRILSDCEGAIERVAITLPSGLLADRTATGTGLKRALGNFLSLTEPDMTVVLIAEEGRRDDVAAWVEVVAPPCAIEIAATAPKDAMGSASTCWTRDTLLVRQQSSGREYLQPRHDRPSRQKHGEWLSRHDGAPVVDCPVYLPGGDHIVSRTARFVGDISVRWTMRLGLPTYGEALQRLMDLDGSQRTIVFGFHADDFDRMRCLPVSSIRDAVCEDGESPSDAELAGAPARGSHTDRANVQDDVRRDTSRTDRLRQWPDHLDVVLTAPGEIRDGREVLILAELTMPEMEPADGQLDRIRVRNAYLGATAVRLRRLGFHVIRSRIPYLPGLRNKIEFCSRSYNNVIVDGAVRSGRSHRIVWIPAFGEDEPLLQAFDEKAVQLWQGLGFEPRLVQGWSGVAASNGGLRCATQVLARRM